jgi:hypothetical protein
MVGYLKASCDEYVSHRNFDECHHAILPKLFLGYQFFNEIEASVKPLCFKDA